MSIDLSNFTNEELFDMVDSLNMSTIPDNALIRAVTRKIYNTDNETLVQLISMATPIATELAKRLKKEL